MSLSCTLPAPTGWNCGSGFALQCTQSGWQCVCQGGTCGVNCPIIIDTQDQGFHLTDAQRGVRFTFYPHSPVQISWTDANYANGFLTLDRNGNRTVDDGTELFGNLTPQPPSQSPNGFLALAVFDLPTNGGNENGFIDPGDAVYRHLRVWIDGNHNGVSEPSELHTLPNLGILRIGLRYHETPFGDSYGNQFRYAGRLWDQNGHSRDICYDVYLQVQAN